MAETFFQKKADVIIKQATAAELQKLDGKFYFTILNGSFVLATGTCIETVSATLEMSDSWEGVLQHSSEPQAQVVEHICTDGNRSTKTKTSRLCGRLQHPSGQYKDSRKHSK